MSRVKYRVVSVKAGGEILLANCPKDEYYSMIELKNSDYLAASCIYCGVMVRRLNRYQDAE